MHTGAAGARKTKPVTPLVSAVPFALPAEAAAMQAITAIAPKSWRRDLIREAYPEIQGAGAAAGPLMNALFRLATG